MIAVSPTQPRKQLNPLARRILRWVNLRPEEAERTLLMFLFYASISIGAIWLEATSAALFLGEYSVQALTLVYMATAGIVTTLGVFYSWLQRHLPLRIVMLTVSVLLALPLLGFWYGLGLKGTAVYATTVFAMRLWVEAIYTLSNVNNDIAANQLFNIREVKRAFPLVSTGIIVAEIISGFSLPFIIRAIGISNVALASFVMLMLGAVILFYVSQRYRQAFPNSVYTPDAESELSAMRLKGNIRNYKALLFIFFIAAQILFFLIDYQFYSQLNATYSTEIAIAQFVGIFGGILGIFKLCLQLFGSSRIIERIGLFIAVMMPPIAIAATGAFTGFTSMLLWGFVAVKFFDELFRFTIVATTAPVLFQPVPEQFRSRVQSQVRGIADPLSTGGAGLFIWGMTQLFDRFMGYGESTIARSFAIVIITLALAWLVVILLLRQGYTELLIQNVERGQLSLVNVDAKEVRRAVSESLTRAESASDQYVELLTQVAPEMVGEILSPLLPQMTPEMQKRSLEAMLLQPAEEKYLPTVRELLYAPTTTPDVKALSLRYSMLADPVPDVSGLRNYLQPAQNPLVRSAAVAMMMRFGTPEQVAEATNTLRQMLTSPYQSDRVLGCRALADAAYLQSLRFYVPQLLQDRSIEVRCTLLGAIAATKAEEFYPSLIRGLHYKATRQAAYEALIELGDDALDYLDQLGIDSHYPTHIRLRAWEIMGKIGTTAAISLLGDRLVESWGARRRTILKALIKIPAEAGIEATIDKIGRSGVEKMVHQELYIMGEMLAGIQDLPKDQIATTEAELLRNALADEAQDCIKRMFMLMRLLYAPSAIQAAEFNLSSKAKVNVARGIEILDNTFDLSCKQCILSIVDNRPLAERLRALAEIYTYQPMSGIKRLRYLVGLRYCLSDWTLACCFHVARTQWWSLHSADVLACLEHSAGFVREAVMAYLQVASPRALHKLLPRLENDRDKLVGAQARAIATYFRENGGFYDV
ncbi:heat repeat-containing PBS lyase [Thalassoporum mexicanum PCC 7367]|nr:heat repeat-containing PBS lyase [Pseudanabaena sp. PCC 7367]